MNDNAVSATNGSNVAKLPTADVKGKRILAETADNVRHTVSKSIADGEESVDDLRSRFASIEAQLRETGERLLASAKNMSGAASVRLRAHPLQAVAAALVGGIVISQLLRSKGR